MFLCHSIIQHLKHDIPTKIIVIADIVTIMIGGKIQVISMPIPRKIAEIAGILDLKNMQNTPFFSFDMFMLILYSLTLKKVMFFNCFIIK